MINPTNVRIDRAGTGLALVQYDHHLPRADEFRATVLDALSHKDTARKLNVFEAYYYDDAIWLHSRTDDFTSEQLTRIDALVQNALDTLSSGR